MNRLYAIAGFLATGMTLLLVWFVVAVPWMSFFNYASVEASRALWYWISWGTVSAVGIGVAVAFFRYSLKEHWTALRCNAPISPAGWRGVFGVYLILSLAFAPPLLEGDPTGTHHTETYLGAFSLGCCLLFGGLAVRRGFLKMAQGPSRNGGGGA